MIGSASSKYFEGILFILVRRPYGIGDIIHISNTELETNPNGSVGWIVQKVTLFESKFFRDFLSERDIRSLHIWL
jgi:hypothetical protein